MPISRQYKNNLKRLAGLVQESIELKATKGRSESGTLSWYAEEYILNVAEQIINNLDAEIMMKDNLILQISESNTKIATNTFSTKLNIKSSINEIDLAEFLLTVSVNFEQNSNTIIAVTLKGVTNTFRMNSKHSMTDLKNIQAEAVNSFLNSLTLLNSK